MNHKIEFYRNIPFIDSKFPFIYFQKTGKRLWIELPFIGFTFRFKNTIK
jgi:hypothetical protein